MIKIKSLTHCEYDPKTGKITRRELTPEEVKKWKEKHITRRGKDDNTKL